MLVRYKIFCNLKYVLVKVFKKNLFFDYEGLICFFFLKFIMGRFVLYVII